MRTLLFLITIILFSTGKAQVKAIIPENTITEMPDLDVISNSEIGETLVSKESGYKYKAIRITNGSNVNMGFGSVKINKGDVFVNKSTKKEYDLYVCPYDDNIGIAINRETNEMKVYAINAGIYFGKVKKKIEFENFLVIIPNKKNIKQEFIYNGKISTTLKFIYREFFDDMARPSFTQELVYDLKDSEIIGFKGLRIKVLNNTNTNIEYKILSYFK